MKIHHSRGLLFESEMRSRPSHSRSICDGDSETSRLGKKLQGVMVYRRRYGTDVVQTKIYSLISSNELANKVVSEVHRLISVKPEASPGSR